MNLFLFDKFNIIEPKESSVNLDGSIKSASAIYEQLLQSYDHDFPTDSDAFKTLLVEYDNWLNNPNDIGIIRITSFTNVIKELAILSENEFISIDKNLSIFEVCENVLDSIEKLTDTTSLIGNGLKLFMICGEFLHFIKDLYDYVLDNNAEDLRRYALLGAIHLNVTWYDYRNHVHSYIENIHTMSFTNLLKKLCKSCFHVWKKDTTNFTEREKDCIAVADYAYCDSVYPSKGESQKIYIEPIVSCPTIGYDKSKMQFDLTGGLRGSVVILAKDEDYIVLSFSGTKKKSFQNWLTDVVQILSFADSVYFAALGITIELEKKYSNTPIIVTGHSLGGGLAQFVVSSLHKANINGICYNSAGLSNGTLRIIKGYSSKDKTDISYNQLITHIVMKQDPVSKIGNLLGIKKIIESNTIFDFRAHECITINMALNNDNPKYCVPLCQSM